MCELSAADGFVEINENLGDMIKYVANEPSVGLYYIQQHAQNAVPNIIKLKNDVSNKAQELSFHTQDLEDSISMTRTMKQCGPPVIDEMIRDIKASLTLISNKQPVRGAIQQRSSSSLLGPVTWARSTVTSPKNSEKASSSYFSSVFKSAKEKAGNLKWQQGPQIEAKEPLPCASNNNDSSQGDEIEELPISSLVEDEVLEGDNLSADGKSQPKIPEEREFDQFKADKEARLEEWLEGSGNILRNESGDDKGYGHHLLDSM